MNGELAQSLAIATHVTMWLAGSRDERLSVPEFADMVAFDSVVGVDAWGERLAGDGVERLWLAAAGLGIAEWPTELAGPMGAGFVGGVPVGVLSTGPAGGQLWRGQWSGGTRVADGAQILLANYLPEPAKVEPARVEVGTAIQELDAVLRRAERFAEGRELPGWARVFARARRSPEGEARLFPASWPDPDGVRLADMALAAWVFGGMGSWNDLGFDDGAGQREYEQVSGELLDAVLRACVASVNIDLP